MISGALGLLEQSPHHLDYHQLLKSYHYSHLHPWIFQLFVAICQSFFVKVSNFFFLYRISSSVFLHIRQFLLKVARKPSVICLHSIHYALIDLHCQSLYKRNECLTIYTNCERLNYIQIAKCLTIYKLKGSSMYNV